MVLLELLDQQVLEVLLDPRGSRARVEHLDCLEKMAAEDLLATLD